MKTNIQLVMIISFLTISCKEISRKNAGSWEYIKVPAQEQKIPEERAKIPEAFDVAEDKKQLAKLEVVLKEDFKLKFKGYYKKGNRWAVKVQVPLKENKRYLLQILEDFEIKGERILGTIGNEPTELKYKGELEIKVEAVKYFIENHDRDDSLFIKPQAPKPAEAKTPPKVAAPNVNLPAYCNGLAGLYKELGNEENGESIEIRKIDKNDCLRYEIKINDQNFIYKLKLTDKFGCKSMGSYSLCTKGDKSAQNLISFIINEKWKNSGCETNQNLNIDIGRGILNLFLIRRCNDGQGYKKSVEYHLSVD